MHTPSPHWGLILCNEAIKQMFFFENNFGPRKSKGRGKSVGNIEKIKRMNR